MYSNSPYKEIPLELLSEYTLNNKIKIIKKVKNGKTSKKVNWSQKYIDECKCKYSIENILNNVVQTRYDAGKKLIKAFNKYNIKNKNVAVLGSEDPWIECILLNLNNKVSTIEYNIEQSQCEINCMDYNDFIKSELKFDVIISYSSIEHSGLGRYGDPLDPNGDIKTTEQIYNHLIPNGLFILGVPINKTDILVWNAHRIYGKLRYSLLINKFKEIDRFNIDSDSFIKNIQNKETEYHQPVIVLNKN